MNKKVWSAIAFILSIFMCSSTAYAQDPQQEVDKQVSKLIGDAISARVAQSVIDPMGDKNSAWLSHSRVRVKIGGFGSGTSGLTIAGYDRDISAKFLAGVAASYSKPGGFGLSGHGWSLDPYLAYRFTENLFAIGKITYGESESSAAGAKTKSELWGADVSLNGLYKSGNFLVKGRGGVGFRESESRTRFGGMRTRMDDNSTQYVADAELGYFFMPDFYGFAGLQVNDTNKSDSYSASARIGLEKRFAKQVSVLVKYEEQIDDNLPSGVKVDVKTFTAAVRIAF